MGKKITGFKTKGMNRDLSVSAFNPEFSFENINLRLSTNEGNTMLSWVNERGPKQLTIEVPGSGTTPVSIQGTPIGTAVLNRTLVLFTHKETAGTPPVFTDYIYKLEYKDNGKEKMSCVKLYEGDLHFRTEYPLETLVSYEAEHIQKVYWTDGLNQPRIINIKEDYTGKPASTFDFVPELALEESVTIERNVSSGGAFPPGVIQYCFTYINKYRQQSNVAWVSSLYYLTHDDRGASPEDFVTGSFKITIDNPDTNFDYLRLYSIQRTSIDADPIVKLLDDISTEDLQQKTVSGQTVYYLSYVDNGTTGAALDPFELLYVGGKEITAKTLADSNNTLFLGNITSDNMMVDDIQDYFNNLREASHRSVNPVANPMLPAFSASKSLDLNKREGVYAYNNLMAEGENLESISTYKGGETYRLGFQLQSNTGEWSEPIFIDDVENTVYPSTSVTSETVNLVAAEGTLNLATMEAGIPGFHRDAYKKIRPVAVFPNIGDRSVICQGVLNPTVFNPIDRIDNSPFAQSSWYFRPFMANDSSKSKDEPDNLRTLTYETYDSSSDTKIADAISANSNVQETGDYYVIFVNIPENYTNMADVRENILNRRYLKWTEVFEAWYPEYNSPQKPEITTGIIEFKGAIKIKSSVDDPFSNSLYALFSTKPWKRAEEIYVDLQDDGDPSTPPSQYYRKTSLTYDEGVTMEYLEPNLQINTLKMSNNLSTTSGGLLFNRKDTGNIVFKFWDGTYLFTATFAPKGSSVVVTENKSGNALAFTHYASLPTDTGISGIAVGSNVDKRSAIEVQGSNSIYSSTSLFGNRISNLQYKSNSQFFVDQSIVTMHSPDIEFDTDVQNFGMSNVKLRIVGAVPITGNASAHTIRTSSPMLERGHNTSSYTASFGSGEINSNTVHKSDDATIDANAGNRLVSDYLWNDVVVTNNTEYDDKIETSDAAHDFLIHPWQRQGSLNNDTRPEDVASSTLKTKKESNILYSYNTEYLAYSSMQKMDHLSAQMFLTENNFVLNMRFPKQKDDEESTFVSSINYYPNIDKVLYNADGYKIHTRLYDSGSENVKVFNPIVMKYKSTSHAVIALKSDNDSSSSSDDVGSYSGISILPYGYKIVGTKPAIGKYTPVEDSEHNLIKNTIWGDTNVSFHQRFLDIETLFGNNRLNFLWIGELYRDVDNPFGGTSKAALRSNKWVPAGEAVSIPSTGNITINWTEGDTFYQRYDCLKTYPFTNEDQNQLVEILSFMCETRVNIDGRYDKNRGQMDNTNMSPRIFNLLNPVYSQRNNFFPIRQISQESEDTFTYPNLITFSKTKTPGADVDLYTNVTLASNLDLDGDKGGITAIRRFNDQLIAFQDTGIARIIYNVNAAIATTAGVPIEIANSGKVEGNQYFSDTIGCSNKDSMVTTPSGIYFMDSHDKSIYLFNGQLANLSTAGGMNSWVKSRIPSPEVKWNPVSFGNFKTFYDRLNQDVLFVNNEKALAWSEKMGAFTSFYNYEGTPYFNNLDNTGIWVRSNGTLWKHNAGNYCNFFGTNKPYSMTLVGNPVPQGDCIFTNLEFRANISTEGDYTAATDTFVPHLPFDSLEAWNEYQHGLTSLANRNGSSAYQHFTDGVSTLKRKFRMWRCDIPRDNALVDPVTEAPMGIKRFKARPVDRMRNPWIYLKLMKNAATQGNSLSKTEIHDIILTYFS